MGWSPRAGGLFALTVAVVVLLVFLGVSVATGNWRFFLWSILPASISLSTGLSLLASRRPTPRQNSGSDQ